MSIPKTKYKGVTIQGASFPDSPIRKNLRIKLNQTLREEYIPALNRVMVNDPYGFRLLLVAMTYKEGFRKGTRSYRYNNPGNIGNTDNGSNRGFSTLEHGIIAQREYMLKIINGNHRAYPLGKLKVLKPYYSPEIARNPQYGLPPYVPGYRFVFTGAIEEFVKIYATGARVSNNYISTIISFFNSKGFDVNEKTLLQDLIKLQAP